MSQDSQNGCATLWPSLFGATLSPAGSLLGPKESSSIN